MSINITNFDWDKFWEGFSENPESIEGIIWRKKDGVWKAVFVIPNSFEVLDVPIYYNPFTGEKLE